MKETLCCVYCRLVIEGLPGVWGNERTLAKYLREHKPTFREQGNKTVQITGRKHFDIYKK